MIQSCVKYFCWIFDYKKISSGITQLLYGLHELCGVFCPDVRIWWLSKISVDSSLKTPNQTLEPQVRVQKRSLICISLSTFRIGRTELIYVALSCLGKMCLFVTQPKTNKWSLKSNIATLSQMKIFDNTIIGISRFSRYKWVFQTLWDHAPSYVDSVGKNAQSQSCFYAFTVLRSTLLKGPETIWHCGQFGTADNLAPQTIWHHGQFGTADNFAPRTI